MGENSKIEWTDHTGNLWWGCVEVHEGCDNCYARVWDNRYNGNHWGNDRPRRYIKSTFSNLHKWQAQAKKENTIKRVFVGSMMDIFEKPMPLDDAKLKMDTGKIREMFFNDTVPLTPNLLYLLLTKRPSNINKYIPESWKKNPPANVMFGTSPVNQATADNLIPHLLQVNGRRFLSVEPQLAELSLKKYLWTNKGQYCEDCGDPAKTPCDNSSCRFKPIEQVICGGESGHGKRPFNTDWARLLRDECKEARVPFFMKQIDKIQPIPEDLMIRQFR